MANTLEQVAAVQAKADVVQAVVDHLRDSTKTLSTGILNELIRWAESNSGGFPMETREAVWRATQHQYQFRKLENSLVPAWNNMNELQSQLDQIRKFHGFQSADALKAAVEAGQRAPVAPAKTTTVHVSVSEQSQIIAKARERAAQAKARAEAAQK